MTPTLTLALYAAALLSGGLTFYYFFQTYRDSGRRLCYHYLFFLIGLSALLVTTTVAHYTQHAFPGLVLGRLTQSTVILSCSMLVWALPNLVLSLYYHPAASQWHYVFSNAAVVTSLMTVLLWFWPVQAMATFPVFMAYLALGLAALFSAAVLYQNRDAVIKASSTFLKLAMVVFFVLVSLVIYAEATAAWPAWPGLTYSFPMIFLLWNGLSLLFKFNAPGDSLATKSAIQAFKRVHQLSDHEEAIIENILAGKMNAEIAREMNLPKDMLNNQINKIFQKVKIQNRLDLLKKIHELH